MYLFVYIMVILSVLGLYTQLFAMRAATLASKQKGVAETMMLWHGGTANFIRDRVRAAVAASLPIAIPANGCLVFGGAGPADCGTVPNIGVFTNNIYLPGYNIGEPQLVFPSVLYESGGVRYVLTFQRAGEMRLGFTDEQFYAQLQRTDIPRISYGRVVNNGPCGLGSWWLATTERTTAGTNVCHPLPAAVAGSKGIAVNSIGIITIAQ